MGDTRNVQAFVASASAAQLELRSAYAYDTLRIVLLVAARLTRPSAGARVPLADAESPRKKRSFRLAPWQGHPQDCQIGPNARLAR